MGALGNPNLHSAKSGGEKGEGKRGEKVEDTHPLAGEVLEAGRPCEFHFGHVTRQKVRVENVQLHELCLQRDDLVKDENDARNDEEDPESGAL